MTKLLVADKSDIRNRKDAEGRKAIYFMINKLVI